MITQIIQIIISIILVTLIILQAQGTGLGSSWGGTGEFHRSKRGVEKLFFTLTIIFATLFVAISIFNAI